MLLPSKDGIICDYCSMECRTDFVYYSYDFAEMIGSQSLEMIHGHPTIASHDVCAQCMAKHAAQIRKFSKACRKGYVCDLTGAKIIGETPAYFVKISQAIVKGGVEPKIDSRYVELTISADCYAELNTKFKAAKSQWSSSSA